MKSCHSNIIINKPIDQVWAVLTDFDRYLEWNPLVGKIRGTMAEGKMVLAHIIPLKSHFPLRIISYKPQQEIVWQGAVINPSILVGEHYYYLKNIGNGQTELQHGENFTGWLSKMMPQAILSRMQDSYEYHNQKLKVIVENS